MAHRSRHEARKTITLTGRILRILFAVLIVAAILWPFMETWMLDVEYTELRSPDLPADVESLKIVYLTDIHRGGMMTDGRVSELVTKVNALRPDIILLGGDYAEDYASATAFFQNLPAFHAKYAIYGVLGDKDLEGAESGISALENAMMGAGVIPLVNEVAPVRLTVGSTIYIAGTDDPLNGRPAVEQLAGKVRQSDYVILLSHSPNVISSALTSSDTAGHRNWFDLGLFGHTHGGQFPLLGQLMIATEVNSRYRSGWLQENRIDMLVSKGVGTTVLPVRLLCKPQIHVITIRRGG